MSSVSDSLARLNVGSALSELDADALFETLLSGGLNHDQITAVLVALHARGPTIDEVVGAARAMRRHVTRVPVADPSSIVDTCGTGGAPKTFNVSTAAAIVAAGAGARVAKHGNRSRTGRGSAEVLAALGVNVDASPAVQAICLKEAGVCFCFAIHHHPAAKHAGPARRALNHPTIFNVLGPLTNPAGAARQVVGVYAEPLVDLVAGALARLGSVRAMVLHSRDGLDEISIAAPTGVAEVCGGGVARYELDPGEILGDESARGFDAGELVARDVADSASMIRAILAGEQGPRERMVVLNAAAALVVTDVAEDFDTACVLARQSIRSGAASGALSRLIEVSHQSEPPA